MRATQPGQSFFLLLDVVDVLKTHKIDYAVIGAMAASIHGVVRASLDADALLSLTTQSLRSLEGDFRKIGFQTTLRQGAPDDPITAVLTVSDSLENRADLLVGIKGLEAGAFSRAVNVPFGPESLRVIGLEDFIAMKVFAGGPQDLSDARRAIAVSASCLNRALLQQLTGQYGKKYARVLKTLLE